MLTTWLLFGYSWFMEIEATKVIAKVENAEFGMAAVVAKITGGFSVAVLDTDAGEYYPMAFIYTTEAAAMAKAQELAA